MANFIDITGNCYGRLTIEGRHGKDGRHVTWRCRCSCGTVFVTRSQSLRSGITRSCGCLQRELAAERNRSNKGDKHPNWQGGRNVKDDGYVVLYSVDEDGNKKYLLEHRVKMSEKLGRALHRHENVHHKNGNRADNRLKNLELWSTMQPSGKRIKDLVRYAVEILKLYAPELLK